MHMVSDLSFIVKMKEFSRSQAVTFTSKVVVSKTVLDRNIYNRPLTRGDTLPI